MTKLAHTEVFPTNSLEAGQKKYTVAGLPLSTAIVYVLLFAVALWFYTTSWVTAPIVVSDSPTYLSTAQRLLNLQISELRTPGYPLLLVLTGSAQSPNRTLFLFRCCYILRPFGYLPVFSTSLALTRNDA